MSVSTTAKRQKIACDATLNSFTGNIFFNGDLINEILLNLCIFEVIKICQVNKYLNNHLSNDKSLFI